MDRQLTKRLKNDLTTGARSEVKALRSLLNQKCRENPDDLCLMHNRALVLALDLSFEKSSEIFAHVSLLNRDKNILEHGWQENWVIQLLRIGEYQKAVDVL